MDRLGREIQGDLGEQARIRTLGGNAHAYNLNQLTTRLNSPLLDLATKKSFESVKVFDNPKKYVGHLCDLQAKENWASSRQIGLVNKAAKAVLQAAGELQQKGVLPKGLTTRSSHGTVVKAIREKTIIAVPDDHVRPARRYLLKHIKENPEVYGLKPGDRKAIAAKFKALKGRFQGCGRNYSEILNEAVSETNRLLGLGRKPSAVGKPGRPFARQAPPATPRPHPAPGPSGGKPSPAPPGASTAPRLLAPLPRSGGPGPGLGPH
jgi:hypothetical protein